MNGQVAGNLGAGIMTTLGLSYMVYLAPSVEVGFVSAVAAAILAQLPVQLLAICSPNVSEEVAVAVLGGAWGLGLIPVTHAVILLSEIPAIVSCAYYATVVFAGAVALVSIYLAAIDLAGIVALGAVGGAFLEAFAMQNPWVRGNPSHLRP